ncbi:protein-L-isoaspartate(D-aspartate) O-methyltransferase [Micromonospora craterilacus]|uniref:Protein-L-isoaspartate O-methyltransferase n=1 Tax=Micromonospora craterilacus TaxID=1655439 RepID=A0A2W2E2J3_9ACTN|nr:ATP-grasp peptide maturase system methyltransferase [Micromonospora craterilacus]PZG16491.1 protein-L-isoaspartate(D-aspartate) O-methyltransferase [Micromonospora craterilacus]
MTTMTDYRRLRQQLVAGLEASGHLTSPTVAAALAAVPRHEFAPAVYRLVEGGQLGEVMRADNPACRGEYLRAVYSDEAIVTQIAPDGRPTSSSTQPGVMAVMLEALDLRPGCTVLEIGTGTGYNAALLSQILGDKAVTSVDIDPHLVTDAASSLAVAGYRPTVTAADGLSGYLPGAPYDRIIATCSVRRVPAAWLRQSHPGGLVLANLSYGVVPLRLDEDGTASGRFVRQVASFIEARPADGPLGPTVDRMVEMCMGGTGDEQAGEPADVELLVESACEFFWRLAEPGVYQAALLLSADETVHLLVDAGTDSWARVHAGRDSVRVVQAGERRVWNEVVTVCRRWRSAGRPDHDRLGLTVTPDGGHTLWVDQPDSGQSWQLTGPQTR